MSCIRRILCIHYSWSPSQVLIGVGMILNSIGLSFDQPQSSPEQDPTKRLNIERESFRNFFDRQRSRALKRQKRVGQYAWLMMIATIASFIWLYADTVRKSAVSNRIALLQTLRSQDRKELVLSMTLSDGSNIKYLIRPPQADKKQDFGNKVAMTNETISSWELEKLGTALSVGEIALPLGIAVKNF
jgi:hypothetical protein